MDRSLSRREILGRLGNGFGLLGLAGVMASAREGAARGAADPNPLAPRAGHRTPRARRAIFLFMGGGPSQIELFDPKPRLAREHGKPYPYEKPKLQRTATQNLMASPFLLPRRGRSGIEISELLPSLAGRVDDLCIVRSMQADNINHANACLQMVTGEQVFSRPSLGSWLLYGLGTENENLPGFIVLGSPAAALHGSSFLPATFQGTAVADLKTPIPNLGNANLPRSRQRRQLDLARELDRIHSRGREEDSRLEARIASFELAFRMQVESPEAFDFESEPALLKRMYGLEERRTEVFGKQCLVARRLVERGVRFVQVHSPFDWDHHTGLRAALPHCCASMDVPVAALLEDLKARGLLDETLVIWGGEFGRTPVSQKDDGRDHHPHGFTMWMAGGGVKGGIVHGATDEFGWHAIEDRVHVHDLHATILHLMGIDHERLTYRYSGRDYRLTDVSGHVVKQILV
jgi:hypothetical protein